MGTIETTYDLPKNLTLAKAVGRMTADDFPNGMQPITQAGLP